MDCNIMTNKPQSKLTSDEADSIIIRLQLALSKLNFNIRNVTINTKNINFGYSYNTLK